MTEAAPPPAASAPLLLESPARQRLPSDQLKAAFPVFVKRKRLRRNREGAAGRAVRDRAPAGRDLETVRLRQGDDQTAAGRTAPTGAKIIARHSQILGRAVIGVVANGDVVKQAA